jgi:hypothetical protein
MLSWGACEGAPHGTRRPLPRPAGSIPILTGVDVSDQTDGSAAGSAQFGQLARISARLGWPHEAHEFTPWLADNVGLLGQAVGLSLELREREHKVGRYSLDLLLSDAQERVVIVENQFGQTDHDHLGKLLTYCAGTEADVVIWIAEQLNEEHVAVLEWLNENTVQGVGFFGVELELLRIDDSRPAPNFRVLVQPNEWVKRVRPATGPAVDWDWENYGSELKITDERLAVGRALAEQLEHEIAGQGVPWTIQFRKGYLALLRPGGYRVAIVDLYWKNVPRFAVRLPDTPGALGLSNPYPQLAESWDAAENMWGWTIPTVEQVPAVGAALALVEPFNPETGPMVVPTQTKQQET